VPSGAKKRKGASRAGRAGAARALPDPGGDASLNDLSRDALSAFLYVALLPEETRSLVKQLRLRVPGFRTESLSDVGRCDVLADEIRAGAEDARRLVIDALRAAFQGPPLSRVPLDAAAADDLVSVGRSDHGLTLALWRVLADPSAAVRARGAEALERLAGEVYGPAPEEAAEGPAAPAGAEPGRADPADRDRALAEARAEAEDARGQAEEARRRGEAQRDKLQAQLKEARAREAQAVDEAARARDAAQEAQRARDRAEAALAALQATDAAAEAQRARAAVRDLEGRATAQEARLARSAERERTLEEELRAARAREAERGAAPAAAAAPEAEEPEEAPATWLMPVFTREFYDSLEGWDRRIQRAAFKQASLLAQDVRHPSLRALPLEGLPGYYRVRVATDVRLLYRRTERQNTVEILSLIDREDLDRYIKQAKTR
jgi:mRNA-degrading endonuclease RelE of RelBE toxin-antitoxin system